MRGPDISLPIGPTMLYQVRRVAASHVKTACVRIDIQTWVVTENNQTQLARMWSTVSPPPVTLKDTCASILTLATLCRNTHGSVLSGLAHIRNEIIVPRISRSLTLQRPGLAYRRPLEELQYLLTQSDLYETRAIYAVETM